MLIPIAIAVFCALVLYRRWPDICRSIVNTGLAKERAEPTAVDQFHSAIAGGGPTSASPPAPPSAAEIAAAIRQRTGVTGGSQ